MGTIKQINIKNQTYYFYSDIIDHENVDARLLKVWYLQYWIYHKEKNW